ncbi:MAG TPA: hypothetical protein VFU19_11655 [Iamia sp.]|nr:hypothetical protein [Iamia sp.]
MASFRDRFWTPPVARAVTAPSSILLAGGAAAVGIVATAPLSLPLGVLAGIVAGGLAYGGRVLAAVPRDDAPRIDASAVGEPWRRFVLDAQAARRRFDEAVRTMDRGPVRSRLDEIGARLDDGVAETWRVARRGHNLTAARAGIDAAGIAGELAEAERIAGSAQDPRAARTIEALRAQLGSAERMDAVIADTVSTLRLLDARLDEAVTRAIELSSGSADAAHASQVDGEVDGIVGEMEALRSALEEAGAAGGRPVPMPDPGSPSA